MFSTFSGSSRRPRNINLSGQTSNPFANTTWSPSLASNATKTVSDAQAERERRQLERQRVKAVGTIHRVWRGHRTRRTLADNWRAVFDESYNSASNQIPSQRLSSTFDLLLAFFSARRTDDVQRVLRFACDADAVDLKQIGSADANPFRIRRLVSILAKSLNVVSSRRCVDNARASWWLSADSRNAQGLATSLGAPPEAHHSHHLALAQRHRRGLGRLFPGLGPALSRS